MNAARKIRLQSASQLNTGCSLRRYIYLLLVFFIAAPSATAQQKASATCQNSSVVQTLAVHGPDGATAVFKVSSEDDRAKDTHLCMADYQLVITRSSDQPQTVDLLTSDNDWGRNISIQLSGFSHDGKRILGIFSESGSSPTQQIFEYTADDGSVQLFDLLKLDAHHTPARCLANANVMGTLDNGAIAIRLSSGKHCDNWGHWLLTSVNVPVQHLSKHASVEDLYSPANNAH